MAGFVLMQVLHLEANRGHQPENSQLKARSTIQPKRTVRAM